METQIFKYACFELTVCLVNINHYCTFNFSASSIFRFSESSSFSCQFLENANKLYLALFLENIENTQKTVLFVAIQADNETCERKQSSKVPIRMSLLFISYSVNLSWKTINLANKIHTFYYTRKNAQVVTSLQTCCNRFVHKLSASCVRTACS